MNVSVPPALIPVHDLFPTSSRRWVADQCREGRIVGAIRIGKKWMISAADASRLASRTPAAVPTVDDAIADLRARGL